MQPLKKKTILDFMSFSGVFWVCMLYVFWPILAANKALPASDAPNLFEEWWTTEYIQQILAGNVTFASLVFPIRLLAYYWDIGLFYMMLGFFASLSMFYYLRTQNLSRFAAYGGGLLFGFSGYWFTLFHAGHTTTTLTWGYIVLPFALINRCFQTKKLMYFALLGLTLAWAMPQIDVWMIAMFLFAAYAIWCSFQEWKNTKTFRFLWQVYPRFLITIAVMLMVGFLSLQSAFSVAKSNRESQFKEATGTIQETDKSPQAEAKRKFSQWVFCTNWSLPPEDAIEFFVPGIFGDSSYRPPYPYWGRLGRDYQFEIGKMRPNLRQHTVYIGVVTLMLSLIGAMGWLFSRQKIKDPILNTDEPSFRDVPFWTVASILLMLFAMGRYTPVYNIPYYCLPFGNYLRAPVKWFHLAEIGLVILAGFGIEALLRTELASLKKKAWWVPTCVAGILIILWLGFTANSQALTLYISQLGFGNLAPTLMQYSVSNIARTFCVVLAVGGLLFWLSKATQISRHVQTMIIASIIIIGTADLAMVSRRYVQVVDVGPHHAMNPIIQALKNRTGGRPSNIINYVTSGDEQQDWLSASLRLHGYANMAPSPYDPTQHVLFKKYQNEPLKYWEIKGVRFVLLPRKEIASLVQNRLVSVIGDFQIFNNGTIKSVSPHENSIVLAEVTAYAPLPAVYGTWNGGLKPEEQLTALQSSYIRGIPVTSFMSTSTNNSIATPRPIQLTAMRRQKGVFVTRGQLENVDRPSLLVFNEAYQPSLVATVNGKEVPVGQANGQWVAIEIPTGASTFTLQQPWRLPLVGLSVLTSIAMLLWIFATLGIKKPTYIH